MKKRIIIIAIIVAIVLAVVIFFLVRFYRKVHKYSEIIPTSNISYIEYKYEREAEPKYIETHYRTLTEEEKQLFIDSLNNDSYGFRYSKFKDGEYKGLYYDTFIIHYNNGYTIYFDEVHVRKTDDNGNKIFFKILDPVDCKIDEGMFTK